jgi:predicted RNA-binding protein YlxR (DUF448 family)
LSGIDEAKYEEVDGKIISCSVTVHRLVSGHNGSYTARVYFDEYSKGRDLWVTKPRTMIAKVAEMHALRKACPEELSQAYVEEEVIREMPTEKEVSQKLVEEYSSGIKNATTMDELGSVWADMPVDIKKMLVKEKDEKKIELTKKNDN